jgi:hypothetical protein
VYNDDAYNLFTVSKVKTFLHFMFNFSFQWVFVFVTIRELRLVFLFLHDPSNI